MNEDWKSKRYRYHVTLTSGAEVDTNYFDTYTDLESWIKSGAAGILTPKGFVEIPLSSVKSIQPIEEGQSQGQKPPERDIQAPPAAPPPEESAGPSPSTPSGPSPDTPQANPDHEGVLQIPRD